MNDPRVRQLVDAARAMQAGQFHVRVATYGDDEVAELARALEVLGHSLEAQVQESAELAHVTERINAGLTLDEVLDSVFDSFRSIVPYDRIGVSLLEEDGRILRARWARSDVPVVKIGPGYQAEVGGSSLQKVIATGQPRIINDLEEYLRTHPGSQSTRLIVAEGMRSSLTCPLISMGTPIGCIFFSSKTAYKYLDAHVQVFLHIAGQLAQCVEKGQLYQQLLDLNEVTNQFIGMAAHDLRNPLAVVLGYAEILMGDLVDSDPKLRRDMLRRIHETCGKMLELINSLLDVSVIEDGRLTIDRRPVDLAAFLRDVTVAHSVLARRKSIDVRLDITPEVGTAEIDPARVAQVVDNLVTNAIKFSPPDTTITVRASAENGGYLVSVKDQGQGIPADEIATVFNRDHRTSARPTAGESSTGLGLAIVKAIVEAQGGVLRVESEVGQGSTFSFTIPAPGDSSAAVFAPPAQRGRESVSPRLRQS